MPTRNVNLTKHFDDFITERIASGESSNASEVVREGLRLLEQRDQEHAAKIAWLVSAAQEGIEAIARGEYVTLNSPQEIEDFMDTIHKEVMTEIAAESKCG